MKTNKLLFLLLLCLPLLAACGDDDDKQRYEKTSTGSREILIHSEVDENNQIMVYLFQIKETDEYTENIGYEFEFKIENEVVKLNYRFYDQSPAKTDYLIITLTDEELERYRYKILKISIKYHYVEWY